MVAAPIAGCAYSFRAAYVWQRWGWAPGGGESQVRVGLNWWPREISQSKMPAKKNKTLLAGRCAGRCEQDGHRHHFIRMGSPPSFALRPPASQLRQVFLRMA
eukprot:gene418-biopygen21128